MCGICRSLSGHIATGCGDDTIRVFQEVCSAPVMIFKVTLFY